MKIPTSTVSRAPQGLRSTWTPYRQRPRSPSFTPTCRPEKPGSGPLAGGPGSETTGIGGHRTGIFPARVPRGAPEWARQPIPKARGCVAGREPERRDPEAFISSGELTLPPRETYGDYTGNKCRFALKGGALSPEGLSCTHSLEQTRGRSRQRSARKPCRPDTPRRPASDVPARRLRT